ncbi:MAG TPA: ABC transporter substrate-binding protein [Casimicrobiaceae bacterium]|nr:ABC transporter substrate-binding protein [Casimicrobiaceae bacterium]
MRKKIIVPLLAALVLVSAHLAQAQQARVYRVGIIHEGGPFYAVVDGLKDGLRELGFEQGKHYLLEIRDLKGDSKVAEAEARSLERGKVDLIYSVATSVTTAAKRATTEVPIVFAVGSDPVGSGLVDSFPRPGGRLTGIHYHQSADLTAKRLEILKAMLPNLHRVVTFYDPGNPTAIAAAKSAGEAARQLDIEFVERHVASVHELRLGLQALKPQEVDAYFYTSDAMVAGQAPFIIDTARARRLPTMFADPGLAAQGALVGYGVSYREVGRLSAKYVQRVLTGTSPQNLPVESLTRVALAVNLETARLLGLTIPQAVRQRADEVIER